MDVNEAIKLIKSLKDALYEAYLIGKTYVGGTEGFQKNIDDIIALLEQGEKYKQMWELLEASMEGQYCITPMEVYFKKDTINQQMENIKQKYFLKEAKQDEAKDNRK